MARKSRRTTRGRARSRTSYRRTSQRSRGTAKRRRSGAVQTVKIVLEQSGGTPEVPNLGGRQPVSAQSLTTGKRSRF